MKAVLILLALLVAGGMAWVRLAPSDPARWHRAPEDVRTGDRPLTAERSGARASLTLPGPPLEILTRLDAIALATPRTRRLAGSPETGRITWITRSAFFGFPDYTTASATSENCQTRLTLHARLRFGRSDLGVNAARLGNWLTRLTR